MKLINQAIQELTEDRVKKISFGKGQPKGVDPLKPKKSSGDTSKVGAESETTKKGSEVADMDITTGEHYDVLDKEAKRQKKYDHSMSGDYDDDATDVVKVHENLPPLGPVLHTKTDDYDEKFAGGQHRRESDAFALGNEFQARMDRTAPSSELDRLRADFRQARMSGDDRRMRSIIDQLDAHNRISGGGQVAESTDRMRQLAGLKSVREMLVVTPHGDLDETGKVKTKTPRRAHGLIQEDKEYDKEHHQRFVEAVGDAGLETYHYRGRFYYEGPAVNVTKSEMPKLYAALHEHGFDGDDLQQDDMAFDKVIYPRH